MRRLEQRIETLEATSGTVEAPRLVIVGVEASTRQVTSRFVLTADGAVPLDDDGEVAQVAPTVR